MIKGSLIIIGALYVAYCQAQGSGSLLQATGDDPAFANTIQTSIKPQFQNLARFLPQQFDLVSSAAQSVPGTRAQYIYSKVRITPNEYVHLRIYKAPAEMKLGLTLEAYQRQKSLQDPIIPFDQIYDPALTGQSLDQPIAIPLDNNRRPPIPGNPQDTFPQAVPTSIKQQFATASGFNPSQFNLIQYSTQDMPGGTNYYAKVQVSPSEYVHLWVNDPPGDEPMTLIAYQRGRTADDPIELFTTNNSGATERPGSAVPAVAPAAPIPVIIPRPMPMRPPMMPRPMPPAPAPAPTSAPTTSDPNALSAADKADFEAHVPSDIRIQYIQMADDPSSIFNVAGDYWSKDSTQNGMPGKEFFVKVQTEADKYVHLRVFKPQNYPENGYKLLNYQKGKTATDPVLDFNANDDGPTTKAVTTTPAGTTTPMGQKPLTDTMPADDEVKGLVASIFPDYVKAISLPSVFTAISYRKQVKGGPGVQFFVKVQVSNNNYHHLSIFRPNPPLRGLVMPGQLLDVMTEQSRTDPIVPFGNAADDNASNNSAYKLTPVNQVSLDEQQMVMAALSEFERYNPTYNVDVFLGITQRQLAANPRVCFVKVQTNANKYVHLKLQMPPGYTNPAEIQLLAWKLDKTYDDSIEYF